MIRVIPRNIFRFIIVVLIQALILNNIAFSSLGISPQWYLLFLLLLPFETPAWFGLIIAFVLGLTIDMFTDTLGVHVAASLALAFARPYVLRFLAPYDGYEPGTFPRVSYYGLFWFLRYTLILTTIHHTVYFFLEAFSFQNIGLTLLRIIATIIFSVFVITLSQFIVFRR